MAVAAVAGKFRHRSSLLLSVRPSDRPFVRVRVRPGVRPEEEVALLRIHRADRTGRARRAGYLDSLGAHGTRVHGITIHDDVGAAAGRVSETETSSP